MLEDDGVPGDQGGRDRVDGGHVGIVPGRHDEDDAERLALDHPAKAWALVARNRRREALLRNPDHVAHALLEAAELAAIAHGAPHLLGELGHHLLVHREHRLEEFEDEGATLLHGEPAPLPLGRAGGRQGGVDLGLGGGAPAHQLLAVDGGDADDVGHGQVPSGRRIRPRPERRRAGQVASVEAGGPLRQGSR